jgi:hypothetical protein
MEDYLALVGDPTVATTNVHGRKQPVHIHDNVYADGASSSTPSRGQSFLPIPMWSRRSSTKAPRSTWKPPASRIRQRPPRRHHRIRSWARQFVDAEFEERDGGPAVLATAGRPRQGRTRLRPADDHHARIGRRTHPRVAGEQGPTRGLW